jgi:hypothetical protein
MNHHVYLKVLLWHRISGTEERHWNFRQAVIQFGYLDTSWMQMWSALHTTNHLCWLVGAVLFLGILKKHRTKCDFRFSCKGTVSWFGKLASVVFMVSVQWNMHLNQVNDMDMKGVTREEAVLFLLSLQDQIDLIVQYRKDEYEQIVASQRGDSFHIKWVDLFIHSSCLEYVHDKELLWLGCTCLCWAHWISRIEMH